MQEPLREPLGRAQRFGERGTAPRAPALGAAAPAKAADVCVQFEGLSCDLSGDLGFFRFMGAKFPSNNKKAVAENSNSK